MSGITRLPEIFFAFLRLGCISFGGPVAHLGYLREEFVTRRRWLDDAAYGDLVALCQFLPGPASSQVVFALGQQRAGLAGALVASLCFTAPSALLMILFAYGLTVFAPGQSGWLHGLKLAAVAVVAQAVWGMGRRLCPDWPRLIIAIASAAIVLFLPGAAGQAAVIILGALTGWRIYRSLAFSAAPKPALNKKHAWAAGALIAFLALLVLLPIAAAASGNFALRQFDSFYRAGSLVFGGGHVVLPLLRAEVVPPGWITDNAFLAGYGAAQALPGPLFTFAAFLGTIINAGPQAWLGGLWCLFAILLPAWLLIGGALPFWNILRSRAWAQSALAGANAAVVGLLLAALYDPVWKQGITGLSDFLAAVVAFVLLEYCRIPPWLVVLLAAAAGQWVLA